MDRETTKKWLKYGITIIAVLTVIMYSYYQAQKIMQGPQITLASPEDGVTVSQALTKIKGQAININRLTLDSRDIMLDEKGNFEEKLLLSYGYNIMMIEGWDKFGRKTSKKLEMVYK